jgi:hypothetical protein
MGRIQTPIVPIPDNARFQDIPSLCDVCLDAMDKGQMPMLPVLLFEVCDTPSWPQQKLMPSEAPERMLCVAMDESARRALLAALAEVEKREPPAAPRPRLDFNLKPKTPLKQVYRRMAEYPITVLSLSWADDAEITIIFLRTGFTISEMQKEIPKHVL